MKASASQPSIQSNPYVLKPLDEKTLKVAEKELNEDPKRRESDCELLRSWLKQQPHIKSIETDEFLLRFLRATKFSILKSQEKIENFWMHRTELTQWFHDVKLTDPLVQEISDLCYCIPLPDETDDHLRVFLVRGGCWCPTKYGLDDIMRYSHLVLSVLCMDPRVQIHGMLVVVDLGEVASGHMQNATPNFVKNASFSHDSVPVRTRGLHLVNAPKLFDVLVPVIRMFTTDKINSRIQFHGGDLKTLYKHVPKRILPTQYGGTAGDLFELNKFWYEEMTNNLKYLEELSQGGIDMKLKEQLKLKNATNTNTNGNKSNMETSGVYRKLNVD